MTRVNNQEKCVYANNKKASFDYFVEEKIECGIALRGNEIKSIRNNDFSIKEAWVQIQDDNLVIRGMHIKKYHNSNDYDVDENRERCLLAHKKEILLLKEKVKEDGYTLLPLQVYIVHGKCKVLVGVCKGKKLYDKRQSLKEKQVKRDIAREFRQVSS